MWQLKSYEKVFRFFWGISLLLGSHTGLHASTDCLDQADCSISTAIYQVDVGAKLLSKSLMLNKGNSCTILGQEKELGESSQFFIHNSEDLITSNIQKISEAEQALEDYEKDRADNIQTTNEMRESLAELEVKLDDLEPIKEAASKAYLSCFKDNKEMLEVCLPLVNRHSAIRAEYLTVDSEIFNMTQGIFNLETALKSIDKNIIGTNEVIEDSNNSIDTSRKSIILHNTHLAEYIDNFDLFGENLTMSLYSHLPAQLPSLQMLESVTLHINPKETDTFDWGRPLGILIGETRIKAPLALSNIELLWPLTSLPGDESDKLLSLLTTNHPFRITIDLYSACAMGFDQSLDTYIDQSLETYFDQTDMALFYQLSQPQTLLNTYEVTIDFSKVMEHLYQLANEYGYLSQSAIEPIIHNELKGFNVEIISEVDSAEAAKIPNQLQEDFLTRLLDNIALSSPKTFESPCESLPYWCAFNGWWLPNDASPVRLANTLDNNLLNDNLILTVESTIYTSKYIHKAINTNLPEESLCQPNEISIDGVCTDIDIVIEACPTGQQLIEGVCSSVVVEQCSVEQERIEGVCSSAVVEQCSAGQERIEGVCSSAVVEQCSAGQERIEGVCSSVIVEQCSAGQERIEGVCIENLNKSSGSSVTSSGSGGALGYAIGFLILLSLVRYPVARSTGNIRYKYNT